MAGLFDYFRQIVAPQPKQTVPPPQLQVQRAPIPPAAAAPTPIQPTVVQPQSAQSAAIAARYGTKYAGYEDLITTRPGGGYDLRAADAAIAADLRRQEVESLSGYGLTRYQFQQAGEAKRQAAAEIQAAHGNIMRQQALLPRYQQATEREWQLGIQLERGWLRGEIPPTGPTPPKVSRGVLQIRGEMPAGVLPPAMAPITAIPKEGFSRSVIGAGPGIILTGIGDVFRLPKEKTIFSVTSEKAPPKTFSEYLTKSAMEQYPESQSLITAPFARWSVGISERIARGAETMGEKYGTAGKFAGLLALGGSWPVTIPAAITGAEMIARQPRAGLKTAAIISGAIAWGTIESFKERPIESSVQLGAGMLVGWGISRGVGAVRGRGVVAKPVVEIKGPEQLPIEYYKSLTPGQIRSELGKFDITEISTYGQTKVSTQAGRYKPSLSLTDVIPKEVSGKGIKALYVRDVIPSEIMPAQFGKYKPLPLSERIIKTFSKPYEPLPTAYRDIPGGEEWFFARKEPFMETTLRSVFQAPKKAQYWMKTRAPTKPLDWSGYLREHETFLGAEERARSIPTREIPTRYVVEPINLKLDEPIAILKQTRMAKPFSFTPEAGELKPITSGKAFEPITLVKPQIRIKPSEMVSRGFSVMQKPIQVFAETEILQGPPKYRSYPFTVLGGRMKSTAWIKPISGEREGARPYTMQLIGEREASKSTQRNLVESVVGQLPIAISKTGLKTISIVTQETIQKPLQKSAQAVTQVSALKLGVSVIPKLTTTTITRTETNGGWGGEVWVDRWTPPPVPRFAGSIAPLGHGPGARRRSLGAFGYRKWQAVLMPSKALSFKVKGLDFAFGGKPRKGAKKPKRIRI